MARKPQLTEERKLLAESFGERPYVVTLREEKAAGTNVVLDYTLHGGKRRKPTLGYPVRRRKGRGWVWDEDALERAREEAQDRSAELRLARMREEILEPDVLTVGQAVALYTDPERGGLPRSKKSRAEYGRALKHWAAYLGQDTPWNRVRPSDVTAWMRRREEKGQIPAALSELGTLRTLYNWLDQQAAIEGLSNPLRGVPWKRLREEHRPRRPRYTVGEVQAIMRVRHQVDPRFALFIALIDEGGPRSKAARILRRSAVDAPLDRPPSPEDAPHGWVIYPPLKGQKAPLHLLTAFERRELEIAFDGYLREMEGRWREKRMDYPLFPGVRMRDAKSKVVRPGQGRSMKPVGHRKTWEWLREAERLAKVEHVQGRAYHGIRRLISDVLLEELGLDGLTAAMGWSSRRTPEQIYIDDRRMGERVRAREAMERRRRKRPETEEEP